MEKLDYKKISERLLFIEDKAKDVIRNAPSYSNAGDIFVDVLDLFAVVRDLRIKLIPGEQEQLFSPAEKPEKSKKVSAKNA